MNRVISLLLIGCLVLSGCATYSSGRLPTCDISAIKNVQDQDGLKVGVKFFDAKESKQVFGVDKVSSLYDSVYILIDNRSKNVYEFGKRTSVNKSTIPAEEVAKNCNFNTAARATTYGALAVVTFGLFLIPAIVDGVGSAQANQKMQSDYMYKEIRDDRIQPNGLLNGVVFVDKMKEGEEFVVRLQNMETNEVKLFSFKK